jgi:hypothetical protein
VVLSSIEKWSSIAPRGYSGDVREVNGSTYTVKENTEALVAASEETGLAGNAEEAKHMAMSCDQHADRIIT